MKAQASIAIIVGGSKKLLSSIYHEINTFVSLFFVLYYSSCCVIFHRFSLTLELDFQNFRNFRDMDDK